MEGRPERHFSDWHDLDPNQENQRMAIIARLLEDGHGEDLLWLSRQCSEDELARFFRDRGARQLSRRSRAFWAVVLGIAKPEESALVKDLWPL